jgi:broad specificity phosphatase PhoE
VYNPSGVLYGRIPGFRLSERGELMARSAADDIVARERPIARVYASPLQRAQESAAPIAELTGLDIRTEARIIEPTNHFEGKVMSRALRNPLNWPVLRAPSVPSWGEPYLSIADRMVRAMEVAWNEVADGEGDVVMVSHQLPIWTTHRFIAGEQLAHDPRRRRCDLSSITSFERVGDSFIEVGYSNPAAGLAAGAIDVGAV